MTVQAEPVSAPAHTGHISMAKKKKSDPHATRFGKFLQACIKFSASDLIIKSEQVPKIRLRGGPGNPWTPRPSQPEEFWQISGAAILDAEQTEDLHKFGSVDFAYDYDDQNRFRVNLFQARGPPERGMPPHHQQDPPVRGTASSLTSWAGSPSSPRASSSSAV